VEDRKEYKRPRRPVLPPGIPGWRRASCLGCDCLVVQARDGYVEFGGTRNGSYLIMYGDAPLRVRSTDVDGPPDEPLYLLGVAHQACAEQAFSRIRAGTATLAPELPTMQVEQGAHLPEVAYTLHLPPQPEACPFCDTTKDLTREHVWPDWYSKLLGARGATLRGAHVARGRIDLTVPVCRTCNNTWMSVLENDIRPLLVAMIDAGSGSVPPLRLSTADQTLLAVWAVKTAYLLDAHQQPAVPRGFLHEFARRRRPNESTVVWVAAYTPNLAARSEKRALDFLGPDGPTNNSPNAFLVTFTMLNVLFQVVGHFNGGPMRIRDDRSHYRDALFQLWPTARDISWPPSFGFSDSSWADLTASITDSSDDTRLRSASPPERDG
jgi:hypothetical protein